MFKKTAEQRIVVEADKVASLKESLDARSWNRVAEISKQLQNNPSDDERFNLARELLAISQANISLLGKLGISTTQLSGKLMGSGVESLQNEVLQNSTASVTLPTGEPVFPADSVSDSFRRSLEKVPEAEIVQPPSTSNTSRSIVHPLEKMATLMPDAATDASDFFAPLGSSEEKLIPRGEAVAPTPSSEATAAGPSIESTLKSSAGPSSKTLDPEVEAALWPAPKTDTKAAFEFVTDVSVSVATAPSFAIEGAPEAKTAESPIQPETFGLDVQATSRLASEFGLDAKTIAELGIEPEVLSALLLEIDNEKAQEEMAAAINAEDMPADPMNVENLPVANSEPAKQVAAKDADESPKEAVAVAASSPLKNLGNRFFAKRDSTSKNREEEAKVAVFDDKSQEVFAELDQQVKKAKKKAERDERREVSSDESSKRKQKYSRQDLASFKQIYASRDGSLCLYQDASGHIVSIDASRLI